MLLLALFGFRDTYGPYGIYGTWMMMMSPFGDKESTRDDAAIVSLKVYDLFDLFVFPLVSSSLPV